MYKVSFKKQIGKIIFFSALLFLSFSYLPNSYEHLEQSSSGAVIAGNYISYIGFDPRNPSPGETTNMIFSIQDKNSNDMYDIKTMVEIYSSSTEKRIFFEPWKSQKIGDFEIPLIFNESGTY